MIVCSKCGDPLSDAVAKDPPEACVSCMRHNRQARNQKWVDLDERQARIDADREKNQPKPNPLPEGLNIAFVGDEIHNPQMDWATGEAYTSKSERARKYREYGLNMYSAREHQKMHPSTGANPGTSTSYVGKTDCRSSAERGSSIKTADGRVVQ